jgi:hypothetical protein
MPGCWPPSPARPSLAQITLAAAAVGASTPPAAPVTRSQWRLLVGGEQLSSAYAFDSALNSATFVAGPLLAGGLAAVVSPYAAVTAAGCAKILGGLLLASSPSLSRAQPRPRHARSRRLGALSEARVRVLLSVVALDTFTYGSLLVGAAALTMGHSSASLLIAMLALGEVGGGLGYGSRRWPATPRVQLITLHLVSAFVLLAISVVPVLLTALACLYLTTGIASGSRDTLNQLMLGAAAPPGYQTESFAWLATFMWAGYGAGTATAGQAQAYFHTTALFLLAAMAAVAAAVAAAALPAAEG